MSLLQPSERAWRSLLFTPAGDRERIAKAHTREADAVILDLEDGVAPAAKAAARGSLANAISLLAQHNMTLAVRINAKWREAWADLNVAIQPGVDAIVAPKVESVARLASLAEMIDEIEAERGLPFGHVGIIALIESPLGLSMAAKIASARRVIGLALGGEDFALSLGVAPTPAALDLPCRQLALAAASRGVMALAAPISIGAFKDEEAYRVALQAARAIGATGTLCIHPKQVRIANACFSVSDAEREDAEAVIQAWGAAQDSGVGVIELGGRMIDLPVLERARRVLARAGQPEGE